MKDTPPNSNIYGTFVDTSPESIFIPTTFTPTIQTERKAVIYIFILVCELFLFCGILTFFGDHISGGNIFVIILFIGLGIVILLTMVDLNKLPQNPQILHFKVPLVPWLPVVALFFNIFLLYGLNKLTWVRFAVWMILGNY